MQIETVASVAVAVPKGGQGSFPASDFASLLPPTSSLDSKGTYFAIRTQGKVSHPNVLAVLGLSTTKCWRRHCLAVIIARVICSESINYFQRF